MFRYTALIYHLLWEGFEVGAAADLLFEQLFGGNLMKYVP